MLFRSLDLHAGAPVKTVALVPDDKTARFRRNRIAEIHLARPDRRVLVLRAYQFHVVAPGLQPGGLFIVRYLAVAVLYRVDEQLEQGDVQLFLGVAVYEVGVVQIVPETVQKKRKPKSSLWCIVS